VLMEDVLTPSELCLEGQLMMPSRAFVRACKHLH
jgi:hypothetical protein